MLTQLVTHGGDLSKDNSALSDANVNAAVDYMVSIVK